MPKDRSEAFEYLKVFNWNKAVQDIQTSVDHLKSNGVNKVGVVGFCLGGALSIASSVLVKNIYAAAPFYGVPRKSFIDPSKTPPKVPLQLHFGIRDPHEGFSDLKTQNSLEKILKEKRVEHEFYRYEADHGFANDTSPNYDRECAELARKRVVEFFKKNLK